MELAGSCSLNFLIYLKRQCGVRVLKRAMNSSLSHTHRVCLCSRCHTVSPPSIYVALECLGFLWELHRIYLFKSKTLSQLLISSNPVAQKTKALSKEKSKMKKITISLDVQDPEVTRIAFAIALKNLYSTEPEVEEGDVLGVLAVASVLQFPSLFQK
uniref:BTBDG BTB/POZ domain-containing protein n=1 Tax=Gopherus agassizii TaxID=38772 RepID=A0A452H2J8_9SAUR